MGKDSALARPRRGRRLAVSAAAGLFALTGTVALASSAQATGFKGGHGVTPRKVTICKATNDRKKPYEKIDVDVDTAIHLSRNGKSGKPFSDKGDKWGDIIPDFDFGGHARFKGKNWDHDGRKIHDRDCSCDDKDKGKGDDHGKGKDHGKGHPGPTRIDQPKPTKPVTTAPATTVTTKARATTTVTVKGASTVAPTTAAKGETLPVTGSSSGVLFVAGLGLTAAGTGVLALRRRKLG